MCHINLNFPSVLRNYVSFIVDCYIVNGEAIIMLEVEYKRCWDDCWMTFGMSAPNTVENIKVMIKLILVQEFWLFI